MLVIFSTKAVVAFYLPQRVESGSIELQGFAVIRLTGQGAANLLFPVPGGRGAAGHVDGEHHDDERESNKHNNKDAAVPIHGAQ